MFKNPSETLLSLYTFNCSCGFYSTFKDIAKNKTRHSFIKADDWQSFAKPANPTANPVFFVFNFYSTNSKLIPLNLQQKKLELFKKKYSKLTWCPTGVSVGEYEIAFVLDGSMKLEEARKIVEEVIEFVSDDDRKGLPINLTRFGINGYTLQLFGNYPKSRYSMRNGDGTKFKVKRKIPVPEKIKLADMIELNKEIHFKDYKKDNSQLEVIYTTVILPPKKPTDEQVSDFLNKNPIPDGIEANIMRITWETVFYALKSNLKTDYYNAFYKSYYANVLKHNTEEIPNNKHVFETLAAKTDLNKIWFFCHHVSEYDFGAGTLRRPEQITMENFLYTTLVLRMNLAKGKMIHEMGLLNSLPTNSIKSIQEAIEDEEVTSIEINVIDMKARDIVIRRERLPKKEEDAYDMCVDIKCNNVANREFECCGNKLFCDPCWKKYCLAYQGDPVCQMCVK
jgi:hypothetical protein